MARRARSVISRVVEQVKDTAASVTGSSTSDSGTGGGGYGSGSTSGGGYGNNTL